MTPLDAVLCSLLWVTLLGQGVGLGDPQRSLPTLTMLGFRDSVISKTPGFQELRKFNSPSLAQQPAENWKPLFYQHKYKKTFTFFQEDFDSFVMGAQAEPYSTGHP